MNSPELRVAQLEYARITRDPKFQEKNYEDAEDTAYNSVVRSAQSKTSSTGDTNQRSHFLDKHTLARLKQLLHLGGASGAFPWAWNKESRSVQTWSARNVFIWKVLWFLYSVQTSLLTVYQFYVFYHMYFSNVSAKQKTNREMFMSFFSVCVYLWAGYANLNLFFYKEQIREYINTMLTFNKKYVNKYPIHLDDYQDGGRLIVNFAILTNCSQVLASMILFAVMPHQPWFLFHFIYPRPWYWLIPGVFHQFVLVGQIITSYMLLSWVVVAHVNTVEFWLKEIQ